MLAYVHRFTERFNGSARYLPYGYYGLTVLVLGAYGLRAYTPGDLSALGAYLFTLAIPVGLVAWARCRLEPCMVECPPLRRQAAASFCSILPFTS